MIQAILTNSTIAENSTVMVETGLADQLLRFFKTDRIVPIVNNPHYIQALAIVFRLLLVSWRDSRI
jgi:hypothetical protein